uniref:lipocalin family protein n=1 Tax=Halomonas colorata TaxID=2742615 RepID=UPI0038993F83
MAGPDRDYLWILSRTPTLDSDTEQRLRQRAAELDFPTDELIRVAHGEECPRH